MSEVFVCKLDMACDLVKKLSHFYGNKVYVEVCDYEEDGENEYMIAVFPKKGIREYTMYYKVDGGISGL